MKKLLVLLAAAALYTAGEAQVVSGLYMGTVYSDSTKRDEKYELALSEYRGKITGWAYTTFVVNDTFYYGIRRVKAVREGEELVVTDVDFLAHNFPEAAAKKVRRTMVFPLTGADTVVNLKGTWQTNQTKRYYAVGGTMQLARDNDSSASALVAHLKELGVIRDEVYYQDPVVAKAKTKEPKEKVKPEPAREPVAAAVKKEKRNEPATPAATEPAVAKTPAAKEAKATTESPKATPVAAPAVLPYEQRADKVIQTVGVGSDSLTLSFYDNGVVDGDIISVYVNGQNVLSSAKLTGVAIKKTIQVANLGTGPVRLTLVAESLGSLPPNTGLLIVRDGDKRYDVRFSADLQTNATIVFNKEQ